MPTLNLNEFLQDKDSMAVIGDIDTNYTFPSEYERGLITNAFIQDAAITNAKIGTAAIGTANIGTLTFNEISGGTATLGGTSNGNGLLQIYDSVGTKISQSDNEGIRVFGTTAFRCAYISGGTIINDIAYFGANSSGTVFLQTGVGIPFRFGMNGQTIFQMGAFSTGTLEVNGNLSVSGNIIGTTTYSNSSGYANSSGTADSLSPDGVTAFYVDPDIYLAAGTSVKTAIVPTKYGYKALYTNESPEVWFMDFCENKEKVDPLFIEVTVPPYHFIKCEGGEYQVWGKRKGLENKRFEDKSEVEFRENNSFWNTPKDNAIKLTKKPNKSKMEVPLQAVVSQSNDK